AAKPIQGWLIAVDGAGGESVVQDVVDRLDVGFAGEPQELVVRAPRQSDGRRPGAGLADPGEQPEELIGVWRVALTREKQVVVRDVDGRGRKRLKFPLPEAEGPKRDAS